MSGIIEIKKGREKPIIQQHPWIFSGAIHVVKGEPSPGDIVTVVDFKGKFLARGYWNAKSQIQVRILTWLDEEIDEAWWRRMLLRAIEGRSKYLPLKQITAKGDESARAIRLVNAENDYLPGLVIDGYGEYLVLQALTLHIDQQKKRIAELLAKLLEEHGSPIKGIYERSDVDVRGREGLSNSDGMLWGEEPPTLISIQERWLNFGVDVREGHKTGFYIDQRDNRELLWEIAGRNSMVSSQRADYSVLNLFSYTGGFGLFALKAGATKVINVDSSHDALELAEKNLEDNVATHHNLGKDILERAQFVQADVFDYLRDQVAEGSQWDVVVLDPPKFAQSAKQVESAARGYKDINLNAFKCVKPGGYLMTFSCSGAISADLFQKIVFGALADSGRQAQILKHLGPGDDHPVALTFPEGAYLKGLLLRVY